MSAAGSARLALVPPGPAVPLPEPAAAREARVARGRRMMLGTWAAGCVLIVTERLLAPITYDLSVSAMVLGGICLLLVGGLALFRFALNQHDRAAAFVAVTATFLLVSAIALAGPARHAGVELHLAANQVELDALAAEIRAASAGVAATSKGRVDEQLPARFDGRLQPLGLRSVGPVDGGLLFRRNQDLGYTLLYADGAAGPPWTCEKVRLRFLGGRWYRYDCLDPANYEW